MTASMDTVVLAYTGRLSTSICLHWLKYKMGMKVIAFFANIGQVESLEPFGEMAIESGADISNVCDLRREFAESYILPAIRAGAILGAGTHLAVALARPLIVREMVRVARDEGAKYLAHGCRGDGNDQLRFSTSAVMLDSSLKVLAPLQEARLFFREDRLAYAEKYGLPLDEEPGAEEYERSQNLWGVITQWHGARNSWEPASEDVFVMTRGSADPRPEPEEVILSFECGFPTSLDGVTSGPVDLIRQLTNIGARHGLGRKEIIDRRLMGVTRREFYESPAAVLLQSAHKALEGLVLGGELRRFQTILSKRYAEVVYDGLWFSQLRQSLDAFFQTSQKRVTGDVRLRVGNGQCQTIGVRSPYSGFRRASGTTGGKLEKSKLEATKGFVDVLSFTKGVETAHWPGE